MKKRVCIDKRLSFLTIVILAIIAVLLYFSEQSASNQLRSTSSKAQTPSTYPSENQACDQLTQSCGDLLYCNSSIQSTQKNKSNISLSRIFSCTRQPHYLMRFEYMAEPLGLLTSFEITPNSSLYSSKVISPKKANIQIEPIATNYHSASFFSCDGEQYYLFSQGGNRIHCINSTDTTKTFDISIVGLNFSHKGAADSFYSYLESQMKRPFKKSLPITKNTLIPILNQYKGSGVPINEIARVEYTIDRPFLGACLNTPDFCNSSSEFCDFTNGRQIKNGVGSGYMERWGSC